MKSSDQLKCFDIVARNINKKIKVVFLNQYDKLIDETKKKMKLEDVEKVAKQKILTELSKEDGSLDLEKLQRAFGFDNALNFLENTELILSLVESDSLKTDFYVTQLQVYDEYSYVLWVYSVGMITRDLTFIKTKEEAKKLCEVLLSKCKTKELEWYV